MGSVALLAIIFYCYYTWYYIAFIYQYHSATPKDILHIIKPQLPISLQDADQHIQTLPIYWLMLDEIAFNFQTFPSLNHLKSFRYTQFFF